MFNEAFRFGRPKGLMILFFRMGYGAQSYRSDRFP